MVVPNVAFREQPDLYENPRAGSGPAAKSPERSHPPRIPIEEYLFDMTVHATRVSIENYLIDVNVHAAAKDSEISLVVWREDSVNAALSGETANTSAAYFLDGVYLVESTGQTRRAVSRVLEYIDGLLNEGDFEQCDAVLIQADVERLSAPVMVSILGITLAAKDKLKARSGFFSTVRGTITAQRGREDTDRLLNKYQ